jgi:hypothetical protein
VAGVVDTLETKIRTNLRNLTYVEILFGCTAREAHEARREHNWRHLHSDGAKERRQREKRLIELRARLGGLDDADDDDGTGAGTDTGSGMNCDRRPGSAGANEDAEDAAFLAEVAARHGKKTNRTWSGKDVLLLRTLYADHLSTTQGVTKGVVTAMHRALTGLYPRAVIAKKLEELGLATGESEVEIMARAIARMLATPGVEAETETALALIASTLREAMVYWGGDSTDHHHDAEKDDDENEPSTTTTTMTGKGTSITAPPVYEALELIPWTAGEEARLSHVATKSLLKQLGFVLLPSVVDAPDASPVYYRLEPSLGLDAVTKSAERLAAAMPLARDLHAAAVLKRKGSGRANARTRRRRLGSLDLEDDDDDHDDDHDEDHDDEAEMTAAAATAATVSDEDVDERMMEMSSEDEEEVGRVIAATREEEDPALGVSAATAADHLVVENDPPSSQQLRPRKRKSTSKKERMRRTKKKKSKEAAEVGNDVDQDAVDEAAMEAELEALRRARERKGREPPAAPEASSIFSLSAPSPTRLRRAGGTEVAALPTEDVAFLEDLLDDLEDGLDVDDLVDFSS